MVHLADAGGLVAARECAVWVAGDDRAAQVDRDGFGGGPDIQGQADAGQGCAVQAGPQVGGEATRA